MGTCGSVGSTRVEEAGLQSRTRPANFVPIKSNKPIPASGETSFPGAVDGDKGDKPDLNFIVDENAPFDSSTLLPAEEGPRKPGREVAEERSYALDRGGFVVRTSAGLIQVGIPPETIKDSMSLGASIPPNFVIMGDMFDRMEGLSLAEFEFPSYFNFFVKKQQVNIICTPAVEKQVRLCMQETLLGPKPEILNLAEDFPPGTPPDAFPDFQKEGEALDGLRKTLTIDTFMSFTSVDPQTFICAMNEDVTIQRINVRADANAEDGLAWTRKVRITDTKDDFVRDFPATATIKKRNMGEMDYKPFDIPEFGVTMLGCSHGFDPSGRTTGFVLWMNRKGLMVDPPPDSSEILAGMGIPSSSIDALLVTHCHADHDAGTFQKILHAEKIKIYTTRTIINSFLRKYSVLTGQDANFLADMFEFCPITIGEKIDVNDGYLEAFYSLHVIPCIGIRAHCLGKTIVYSGDTHTSPELFDKMYESGAIGATRRDHLKAFPWDSDLILHEMGVPPIHTPPDVLRNLPEPVKKNLFVVHAGESAVPPDSGLIRAPEWCTIRMQGLHKTEGNEKVVVFRLLRSVFWLSSLSDANLRAIVDQSSFKKSKWKKGKKLVESRGHAKTVHVVQAGLVVSTYGSSKGSIISSLKLQAGKCNAQRYVVGDSFGQECLLKEDWCYPTELRSSSWVHLISFDRVAFIKALKMHGVYNGVRDKLREIELRTMSQSWVALQSSRMAGFLLTEDAKTELNAGLVATTYSAGAVLQDWGDKCESCFLVGSGSLVCDIYGGEIKGGEERKAQRERSEKGRAKCSADKDRGGRAAQGHVEGELGADSDSEKCDILGLSVLERERPVSTRQEHQSDIHLQSGSFAADFNGVLNPAPSRLRITANTDLRCFEISARNFESFIQKYPVRPGASQKSLKLCALDCPPPAAPQDVVPRLLDCVLNVSAPTCVS